MSLRRRLDRIRALQPTASETSKRPDAAGDQPPLDELLGGEWHTVDGLTSLVCKRSFPNDLLHGDSRLDDALGVPSEAWSCLLGHDGDACPALEPMLFLDIETTGLSRGAGTYAFLVGVGSFVNEGFCVRQYFMPDYDAEPALLSLLHEELARAASLVTFNGRTFDWPILRTRFAMAQRTPPFSGEPHIDLLFLARRLWQRVLDSCALSSLERHVLGVTRSSQDVPGYMIPGIYQDYVLRGETRALANVFYHNAIDVLSMAALAGRIGHAVCDPEGFCGLPLSDDLSLGRLLERLGETEAAIAAYRRAGADARRWLGALLKRLDRPDEAMAVWQADAERMEPYASVELAKQYEHRLGDLAQARELVRSALEWVAAPDHNQGRGTTRAALEHRLARLDRRLAASNDGTHGPPPKEQRQ